MWETGTSIWEIGTIKVWLKGEIVVLVEKFVLFVFLVSEFSAHPQKKHISFFDCNCTGCNDWIFLFQTDAILIFKVHGLFLRPGRLAAFK